MAEKDLEQESAAGIRDRETATPTQAGMGELPRAEGETLGSVDSGRDQARGGSLRMNQVLYWLLHWPFILHAALVLVVVWISALLGMNYPIVYVVGYIFLYHIESRHRERWLRRIRHYERRHASQKQLLSDLETVRWLNETLEKAWPVFLEKFASQDFLAPLMPFFLCKYKPWTVQDAVLQSFTLGRTPPMFAGLRALDSSGTDDDMVIEATMEFVAADDMGAVLSVQLRKRLGGLWTKVHISKLHIEGKVRLGLRFRGGWPFVSRLRISFENAPYIQIEARPLSNYGMDMAELPGIASWLDTMLMDALEDSLVKPNMLVINVEKIANTWGASEYTTVPNETPPVAVAIVEIREASQLKPADVNGLADPFVKGVLNTSRFKTSIKWKTLNPKWREVFRLPVRSWETQNRLMLHVRDKDLFRDDNLGYCEVMLGKFRGGERHEICLPLKGVKTGRISFAITVEESPESPPEEEISPSPGTKSSMDIDESLLDSLGLDHYEIIDTGVSASGIFSIMRPGKAVQRKWRGRKGRKLEEEGDLPSNTLFSGSFERDSESSESEEEKPAKTRFWKWSHRGHRDKKLVSGELMTVSEKGAQMKLTVLDTDGTINSPAGQDSTPTPARQDSTPTLLLPATSSRSLVVEDSSSSAPQNNQKSPGDAVLVSDRLNDAGSQEHSQELSPGQRSVRERAKGVVKHAEKTAAQIGHSLFRRRSGKNMQKPDLNSPDSTELEQPGCSVCSPEKPSNTATTDNRSN